MFDISKELTGFPMFLQTIPKVVPTSPTYSCFQSHVSVLSCHGAIHYLREA